MYCPRLVASSANSFEPTPDVHRDLARLGGRPRVPALRPQNFKELVTISTTKGLLSCALHRLCLHPLSSFLVRYYSPFITYKTYTYAAYVHYSWHFTAGYQVLLSLLYRVPRLIVLSFSPCFRYKGINSF